MICVKWHHTVVSICIPLMFRDIEHLFMCSWPSVSSEKHLFRPSVSFYQIVCSLDWVIWILIYFAYESLTKFTICNTLSYLVGCLFHFVEDFLYYVKVFYFDVVSFVYFCFWFPCLRIHIQKIIARIGFKEYIACVFFLQVLWFQVLHLSL